jgi:hypothetical protein
LPTPPTPIIFIGKRDAKISITDAISVNAVTLHGDRF